MLAGSDRARMSNLGGVKAAAEILNMLGTAVETSVLTLCARPTASWLKIPR